MGREPKRPNFDANDDAKVVDDYAKYTRELSDVAGLSELIIAKQRHGATGKVKLRFDARITRFSDAIDDDHLPTQTY